MFITHTERLEHLLYIIAFGCLIALLPILLRIGMLRRNVSSVSTNSASKIPNWVFPALGILFAGWVFSFLVPWTGLHHRRMFVFLAITGMVAFSLTRFGKKGFRSKILLRVLFVAAIGLAWVFNFSTGFFTLPGNAEKCINPMYHHWGAFLGSARSLKAGLAIYRDFPSQYGFGPAALIVACAKHGWASGMFYAFGVAQFIFWLSFAWIAMAIVKKKAGNHRVTLSSIGLILTIVGCFFWRNYDSYINLLPSLGGTRFFPAVMMAALLISSGFRPEGLRGRTIFAASLIWFLGAIWSIEALFFVSLIWWPYYLLSRLPVALRRPSEIYWNVAVSVFRLIAFSASGILLALVIYRLSYGIYPEFKIYTAYVQHIPGPLLIVLTGTFRYAAFIFLFGLYALVVEYRRHGFSALFRALFVGVLLAYAAFSYYIGRSDDSNILPLMPFFAVILFAISALELPNFFRFLAPVLVGSAIAWAIVTNYGSPQLRPSILFTSDPDSLDNYFFRTCENPETSDRGRAIQEIGKKFGESVIDLSESKATVISGILTEWSAQYNDDADENGISNLPFDLQRIFVHRGKEKLGKIGWALLKIDNQLREKFILDILSADYTVDKTLLFGTYRAFRFIPKGT
jgi:hypothetical protein